MGFTPVFGGGTINPADLSYQAYSFSADLELSWPNVASSDEDSVAAIMELTASTAGLSVILPDATGATNGLQLLMRNMGADSITVENNGGGTIGTIATGAAAFFYLTDNSTVNGTWSVFTFGTGSSSADAATLAGMGIKAIAVTLNQSHVVEETASDITITSSDRAKMWVSTGGSIACGLPGASGVGSDFFFMLKNAGSGTLTVNPNGTDDIDNASSFALAPNDAAFICCAGASGQWYTIGKGQAVAFAFTQLIKSVAGGVDVTLTASEAANKLMQFTGLLTGNINVIVPSTAAVYYAQNNTTGAFSLTVKTAAGTGIAVDQGANDILKCDATNVVGAKTNSVTSQSFAVGSASAPSIYFGGFPTDGIYHPASGSVAITAQGARQFNVSSVASAVNYVDASGGTAADTTRPVLSFTGSDTNVHAKYLTKGNGAHSFATNASLSTIQFKVDHVAAATTFITAKGSSVSAPRLDSSGTGMILGVSSGAYMQIGSGSMLLVDPTSSAFGFEIGGGATGARDCYIDFRAMSGAGDNEARIIRGSGTDGDFLIQNNGTGAMAFVLNSFAQVQIAYTASAANYLTLTGGSGGASQPTIAVAGSSSDINMLYKAKGTGNHLFYSAGGTDLQFQISNTAGGRAIIVQGSATNPGLGATFGSVQMTSKLISITSGTSEAPLNIPHGSAPTSPVNGDIWTTTAGIYVRINGATVGPLS